MPSVFNQYSYVWVVIALLMVGLLMVWRVQGITLPVRIGAWLMLVAVVVGIFWMVRPRSSENYQTLADIDATLNNGKPTLLELYSEY